MSILLIDDSPQILTMLEATLEKAGYTEIHKAQSGQEALDFLGVGVGKKNNPVDLILLDILMPGIDGVEVCGQIKADKHFADTMIIMATVKDDQETLKKSFENGAFDYLVKPVSELELLHRVGAAFRLKKEIATRKAREKKLKELTAKLESKNVMLDEQVNTDELTNVGNRKFFMNDLDNEWRRAVRETSPFSLLLIEIDFFRKFEEIHGKHKANECLKVVANIIQIGLKRAGDQVARIDGGQFAVFLPRTDQKGAFSVAEAMRANVEALQVKSGASPSNDFVTVSIGLSSLVPAVNIKLDNMFDLVEKALWSARNNNGNRVESYQ